MSRTSFFSFNEKEPCLGDLAGKISWGWEKALLGFKMWFQCSRGTWCGGRDGATGAMRKLFQIHWHLREKRELGIVSKKQESAETCIAEEASEAVIECRKLWSLGVKETGLWLGMANYWCCCYCGDESVEKYGLGRFLKTWLLQVSVCHSLLRSFQFLTPGYLKEAHLGEFQEQLQK